EIKAAEKKQDAAHSNRIFKDLPPALPATLYALDIYKRARKHNLLSSDYAFRQRVEELQSQYQDEASMGEELFALVAAARERGWDPESLLRRTATALRDYCENPA